ncbi:deoxyribodipyrimidine photo-lyase [Cellulomonas chitinilytica]|uniref:Deoxyribodipyrimidine photo-lyase n=1 Tax=Cellulomonas chitinilytica TaxID=398759 RepID=A0A919U0U7_9CELL|nr:deoxyribodipyrimidine photo-lyase [Cellulomonas chitinilytica]GIG22373.1 deoxyribodipyrimidine photo-lyase [Cellulomonas chitinilytica]
MPVVLWFRRDLRLADHPALHAAVTQARAADDEVVALFVADPALWRHAGTPRLAYLVRSLRALDEATGGRLVVRHGPPALVVPLLVREVGAPAVHVTAATEPYGRRRDDAVEQALGVPLVRTGSPYAVAPGRLRTRGGTPFQVFTPFRTAWLDHGWASPPGSPHAVPWASVRSDGVPDEPRTDVDLPEAGERAALRRWGAFLRDGLDDYRWARDRPDLDGTSAISVHLKYGELHPRTLLADLAARSAGAGAESVATYRSELAWREFHADVLWHHPGAAHRSLRAVVPDDAWASGPQADAAFAAWAEGRTGYPFVDAGMRQLRATGWMHNRVRMVVASFLVKDLHVRWQRGAEHFMTWLVDGDVPQNQLNWQWVAGTGRDAAPYFRVFNPVSQGERFDPDGDYVRRWVPELRGVAGPAVHRPWRLGLAAPDGYPAPLVDHDVERRVALEDFRRRDR